MVCGTEAERTSRDYSKQLDFNVLSGIALTAKFCVNIAFSVGCRTHFGHIAASPYAK